MLQFGSITNPLDTFGSPYGGVGDEGGGPVIFISNIVKLITVAGGIFAFLNLIVAGISYISSGDNPEATGKAWQKIYMSLIGLVIIVAANALAAIIGQLLFDDPTFILNPTIYGPGNPN